jgi:uncharacterized membrane protein
MKKINSEKLFNYVKILAVIGITLAIYLLWEQLAKPSFQPCRINSRVNCDAIISGAVAKTFGLPTPLYGLVGYIVILISAFLKKKKLILMMATFGLVFCLWIAYKEILILNVICPVCIMCQIVMISVFGIGFLLNKV